MASCIPSESMKPFAIISAGILVEYWIAILNSSSTTKRDKPSKVETELAQSMDQEAGNPPSSQEKPESDGKTPSMTAISPSTATKDQSSKVETKLAQTIDQEVGNSSPSQDKPESNGETQTTTAGSFKCIKSYCIAVFKIMLKIWQIVSAVTILVLDIMQFVDYVKANPDESGWSHYSCFVQITMNSANFKTVFVNVFMMHEHVSGAERGNPLSYIWIILVFMLKLLIWPIGITHGFVSLCYIWIQLGTFCVMMCARICAVACFKACPALAAPLSCLLGINGAALKTIEKDVEKGTETDMPEFLKEDLRKMTKKDKFTSPIIMVPLIVLILMVPILSTNYWLSGSYSYMGSLEHVFTERSIQVYFNNIFTQFSSSFRFFATIL